MKTFEQRVRPLLNFFGLMTRRQAMEIQGDMPFEIARLAWHVATHEPDMRGRYLVEHARQTVRPLAQSLEKLYFGEQRAA